MNNQIESIGCDCSTQFCSTWLNSSPFCFEQLPSAPIISNQLPSPPVASQWLQSAPLSYVGTAHLCSKLPSTKSLGLWTYSSVSCNIKDVAVVCSYWLGTHSLECIILGKLVMTLSKPCKTTCYEVIILTDIANTIGLTWKTTSKLRSSSIS